MGKFNLVLKKSAYRDLRNIPQKDVARILKCLEALKENPRGPGCEKLSGRERYRVRKGIYRIIYEIHDEEIMIVVVKVGHRRDIYKKM